MSQKKLCSQSLSWELRKLTKWRISDHDGSGMPQFLGRIDMYFSLCLTWSRNASAIEQAENIFAELRTGQGMRDMRGWSHFRAVSRAVNYFLSLARCYWMIVATEICMRSKMENKRWWPRRGYRYLRQRRALTFIMTCRICQHQHSWKE